jgi:TIR domain
MVTQMPSAFFSYSRHDSEFVLKLAKDLRAAGARVWLDQLDIHPGQRWDSAIEQALADCPHLLVILSPSSVESTNVMDEVSFALEEKKLVIPVLYQDCKIPFRLRRLQYVDARVEYGKGLAELLRMLGADDAADSAASPAASTSFERDQEASKAAAEDAARNKADQERKARERADGERRAAERSAAEAREREKANQERRAQQAEAERVAGEKREKQRIAQEKKEDSERAAKKAEQEKRDHAAATVKPRASHGKYFIIGGAVALMLVLILWVTLSRMPTPPVRENDASSYVAPQHPSTTLSTGNENEPDSEWVQRFLDADQGPQVSGLLPYFDETVSPYYSEATAGWDAIESDKQAYFQRFPVIHYRLFGRPDVTVLQSGGRVVEFDMQYSNRRMDGRTLQGTSHLTLHLRAVDGSWKITGISERRAAE